MSSGSTLPYNVRPKKAIERNLFFDLLRLIERNPDINYAEYRYVGFGAAYLEEFKSLHTTFGINTMHCVEGNSNSQERQKFNNPFSFIELIPEMSSDYISSPDFKQDRSQIIWLDYTSPGQFRDQLGDLKSVALKASSLDVIKFTFNGMVYQFKKKHLRPDSDRNILKLTGQQFLNYLQNDGTYQLYLPNEVSMELLEDNPTNNPNLFPKLLRAMGMRAIRAGLEEANQDLVFLPLSAFEYADGQLMTTLTGICIKASEINGFLEKSRIQNWEFYLNEPNNEMFNVNFIEVPSLTLRERLSIDRMLFEKSSMEIYESLGYHFGDTLLEHESLMNGYRKYYRFLPDFGKVII